MKKLFYQCCEPNEILCYTNPNLKFSKISLLLEITHNVIKCICNSIMCLNGDKKNLINTFYRIVMNTVVIKSNMIISL